MPFELIAKTMQGLEEVLAREITDLGGNDVQIGRRMVSFAGDQRLMYKANLHLRTAIRILKPIISFNAKDPDEVYEQVRKIRWEEHFDPDQTFSIDTVVYSELFRHSKFLSYRVKDGLADYFKEKFGKRPSVRLTNPDIYIHVHVSHNVCTISLDSSGESLHKRGYRIDQTEAPLNEVLAAGMLLLAGWEGQCNFIDPMCGSGTLLIEAALIALKIPPGIYRKSFGFEKWKDFNAELFDELFNEETDEHPFSFKVYGSDNSPIAIAIAQKNIKNASLSKYIQLETRSIQKITEAPENGLLVMNPPYGERISSNDLLTLYENIGERLKHAFSGYTAWILSYREECFDKIGLRPSARIRLMNGALDCEFRKYEIFSGKRKELFQTDSSGNNPQ
jgi:putative N6-adenine-specific DNA methylase